MAHRCFGIKQNNQYTLGLRIVTGGGITNRPRNLSIPSAVDTVGETDSERSNRESISAFIGIYGHEGRESILGTDSVITSINTRNRSRRRLHLYLNRGGRLGTADDLQTVSSIFSVFHCCLGLCELQACPFFDVVFQPLFSVCLFFFPLSPCLAGWFWPDL